MGAICNKLKSIFGNKPELAKVEPINNFEQWSTMEKEIATLLNLVREEGKPLSMIRKVGGWFYSPLNKVPDLIPEKLCRDEAIKRCEYQYPLRVISHEGVGEAFKVLREAGKTSFAEILAYAFTNPEALVEAWMSSEAHARIILNPTYKYFGVAQTEFTGKKYYCVLFCK